MQKTKETFNVPRHVDDVFYRYNMPALQLKVEGRGKMIKTVLMNLDHIAKQLERPSDYILKFIGFECNAPVASQNNKYTVGGDRKQEELQKILDIFIDKYILCSQCQNPETNLTVKKGNILLKCRACGTQTRAEYEHKIRDYIVKKERTQEKYGVFGCLFGPTKFYDNFFPKNSCPLYEPHYYRSEKKVVPTSEDPSEVLHNFWEQKPSKEEILSRAEKIQTQQKWTSDQMLRVVFSSLFDKDILINFDSKVEIYGLFLNSPKSQETTLFCIEKLCTLEKSVIPSVASVLEQFYNHQLLSAENIKNWFEHPHPKIDQKLAQQIRNNSTKFVENLS